jgi:hypothetical protein
MLFYAQKLPKKDLFAHASQYCISDHNDGTVLRLYGGTAVRIPLRMYRDLYRGIP